MADKPPPTITLPSVHPTPSHWQSSPSPLANHRSTPTLPGETSVVIIGSGITGASVAYKTLTRHPSTKIVMLEARELCCGATGRNGGYLRPGEYTQFTKYCTTYGAPEAIKILRFENDTVRSVDQYVRYQSLECDLWSEEGVDVFFEEEEFAKAIRTVTPMDETVDHGADKSNYANGLSIPQIHHPSPSNLAEYRIPDAKGFITIPTTTLSPYEFVCALIASSLRCGLNLQTNTPALSITPPFSSSSPGHWTVQTPRGSISTKKIVLATNAFIPQLHPPLTPFPTPIRSQMFATVPSAAHITADRSYSFLYPGGHNDYLIVRPPGASGEGDVLIGGGRKFAPGGEEGVLENESVNEEVRAYLKGAVGGHFDGKDRKGNKEVKGEWTGIMESTADGMSVVGQEEKEEKRLWVCAGFNGLGMAFSFRCADALVGMLVEEEEKVRAWLPDSFRIERFAEKKDDLRVQVRERL